MDKKELVESIQFIIEWGINDDAYIQHYFRNFLDQSGEADDNSIQLAHEHKEHLQTVDNIESHLDLLINSTKEECAKIAESYADDTTITYNTAVHIAKAIRSKKC